MSNFKIQEGQDPPPFVMPMCNSDVVVTFTFAVAASTST